MSDPFPLGEPVIVLPYRCRGCLERLGAWLLWLLARLALFGAGFVAGCAVEMVRCGK